MKIALLYRQPAWASWMRKHYPEVGLFTVVDKELLNHEVLFITPSYAIDTDYYHILELWYEVVNNGSERTNLQKLGMLGILFHNSPNCLNVLNPPQNLTQWINKMIPGDKMQDEKHLFPKAVDENILNPLSSILLSHADKALHARTEAFKSILDEFESELDWGKEINYLLKGEPIKEAKQEIEKIQELFNQRIPFLSLLPQYPALKESLDLLIFHWNRLIGPRMIIPEVYLSEHAARFADVITEITSVYSMEKRSHTP